MAQITQLDENNGKSGVGTGTPYSVGNSWNTQNPSNYNVTPYGGGGGGGGGGAMGAVGAAG